MTHNVQDDVLEQRIKENAEWIEDLETQVSERKKALGIARRRRAWLKKKLDEAPS